MEAARPSKDAFRSLLQILVLGLEAEMLTTSAAHDPRHVFPLSMSWVWSRAISSGLRYCSDP